MYEPFYERTTRKDNSGERRNAAPSLIFSVSSFSIFLRRRRFLRVFLFRLFFTRRSSAPTTTRSTMDSYEVRILEHYVSISRFNRRVHSLYFRLLCGVIIGWRSYEISSPPFHRTNFSSLSFFLQLFKSSYSFQFFVLFRCDVCVVNFFVALVFSYEERRSCWKNLKFSLLQFLSVVCFTLRYVISSYSFRQCYCALVQCLLQYEQILLLEFETGMWSESTALSLMDFSCISVGRVCGRGKIDRNFLLR